MRSRLRLVLFACLLLASACGPAVYAQNATTPESSPPSISDKVANLKANFEKLQQLWNEQKLALEQARSQLRELQSELENLQQRLITSQQEVQQSMILLEQSKETSNQLQESFSQYQKMMENRLFWWKLATAGVSVIGVVIITALLL